MILYTKLIAKAKAIDWARLGAISGLVVALIFGLCAHLLLSGCSSPKWYGGPTDKNVWIYWNHPGGSQKLACAYWAQYSPEVKRMLDRAQNKLEYATILNQSTERLHNCMEQITEAYIFEAAPPYTAAADYAGVCVALIWPEPKKEHRPLEGGL